MTDGNDQAFPLPETAQWGRVEGLSKREYFAAKAMQGICAKYGTEFQRPTSREAVLYADALIEALNAK